MGCGLNSSGLKATTVECARTQLCEWVRERRGILACQALDRPLMSRMQVVAAAAGAIAGDTSMRRVRNLIRPSARGQDCCTGLQEMGRTLARERTDCLTKLHVRPWRPAGGSCGPRRPLQARFRAHNGHASSFRCERWESHRGTAVRHLDLLPSFHLLKEQLVDVLPHGTLSLRPPDQVHGKAEEASSSECFQ